MARKWTKSEEAERYKQLIQFYVRENMSIGEVAAVLGLGQSTVYDRLIRLRIPVTRQRKVHYNNKKTDVFIPSKNSEKLAEFIGVMLGDGHLAPTQVMVTLGAKDEGYVDYIARLMDDLFLVQTRTIKTKSGHFVIYFGSTDIVRWLRGMGLTHNKVKEQVDIPRWVFSKREFMISTIRGLFDTDGSVYKLKFGVQFSFTNQSIPLLKSYRKILLLLGYHPSRSMKKNIYLTRMDDLNKFFNEIGFSNIKHRKRFLEFIGEGASHSGNCS